MKKTIYLSTFLLLGAAFLWFSQKPTSPALPILQVVTPFSLLDETGTPFTEKNLQGTPTILDFIFTRCQGPCPLMTQRMSTLAKDPQLAHVRFVSITMDPAYDRPEVLAAYQKEQGISSLAWHFLTGEQPAIIALATEVFKVGAGEEPDMHSTRFILLDEKGQVRGYYDSQDPESFLRLKKHALLLQPGTHT
jgi:protein SCO1/2